MSKGDHRKTASWGNSRKARKYRAEQQRLIEQGRYREAQQMDVDDLKKNFGNKYMRALRQMFNRQ